MKIHWPMTFLGVLAVAIVTGCEVPQGNDAEESITADTTATVRAAEDSTVAIYRAQLDGLQKTADVPAWISELKRGGDLADLSWNYEVAKMVASNIVGESNRELFGSLLAEAEELRVKQAVDYAQAVFAAAKENRAPLEHVTGALAAMILDDVVPESIGGITPAEMRGFLVQAFRAKYDAEKAERGTSGDWTGYLGGVIEEYGLTREELGLSAEEFAALSDAPRG